jgi:hypothetical protein
MTRAIALARVRVRKRRRKLKRPTPDFYVAALMFATSVALAVAVLISGPDPSGVVVVLQNTCNAAGWWRSVRTLGHERGDLRWFMAAVALLPAFLVLLVLP